MKFIYISKKKLVGILVTAIIIAIAFPCTLSLGENGIQLPIIMYHSVLNDYSRVCDYVITPDQLESDLKYIKEKGYITVLVKDLIEYVYNDGKLPEKPIMITFDDGNYNNLVFALPLLEKYNMKAVISVVGEYSDNHVDSTIHSYLSWEQMKELVDSGRIEIQNHTYNLHENGKRRGISVLNSDENYEEFLRADLMKNQEKIFAATGNMPTAFAYPFGFAPKEARGVVKEMFKASFSCQEGINIITKDESCLYMLKRYNRPSSKNVGSLLKWK